MKIQRAALVATIALPALLLGACGGPSEESLIASGRDYLDKSDPKAAVLQLKSALQKNDASPTARTLLGRALLASGDPAAAILEFRKALDLRAPEEDVVPPLARAMLATGEGAKLVAQYGDLRLSNAAATADLRVSIATAHAQAGKLDRARESVRQALVAQPGDAAALVMQARLLAADGDHDGALAVLAQVLAVRPGDERAGVLQGELLRQVKQDTDGALRAFRQVVQSSPKSLPAHAAIIALQLEQGRHDEAKAQIEQLRQIAPNHPDTRFFQAQSALAAKDYDAVRGHTEALLKIAPDNARVLELAGVAEYRLNNFAKAETLLGRTVKLAPDALTARHLLAQIFLRGGQPGKVLELLQPVLDGSGPDATTLAMAGEAHLQLGDHRRSDEAYQRATRAAPDNAAVRTAAAMAQVNRGNAGAVAELERIAAADASSRADLALISARLRLGDLTGALKAVDVLQKKMPEQPLAYNLRGRIQLLQRNIAGAKGSFEQALSKDPRFYPAIASLAAIEMSNGDADAARRRFEDVARTDPRHVAARLALAEIAVRSRADKAEVVKLIRDAIAARPNDATAWVVLIDHHLSGGDSKAAMAAAQEATAALPNELPVMDALGRAQFSSGNAQQAVSTFRRLSALQPSNPVHLARLADAQVATKDLAGAAASLRQALGIQPGFVPAQRGLATVALMDRRPADALAIGRELQKSQPKSALGSLIEGDAQASQKNWDAAAAAYAAALQRERTGSTAVRLHTALVSAKRGADAEKMATGWLKENGRDIAFRYYLGDSALSRGDHAQAETHYRSVLQIEPEHALALNNVAWLLVRQGKPGGLAMAQKAAELMPDQAPILDTLAAALAADKQVPKAIETQKRALLRSPENPGLKLNLAKLYVQSGDSKAARTELEALARLGSRFGGQAEVAAMLQTL